MLLTPVATVGVEAKRTMTLLVILAPIGRGEGVTDGAGVEVELCEGGEELAVLDHCISYLFDVSID